MLAGVKWFTYTPEMMFRFARIGSDRIKIYPSSFFIQGTYKISLLSVGKQIG